MNLINSAFSNQPFTRPIRSIGSYSTIDLQYRMQDLNALFSEKIASSTFKEENEWFIVILKSSQDEKPMLDRELLSNGYNNNKKTHIIAAQYFNGNIHFTMSHIRIHVKEYIALHLKNIP